jgi:glycosyltransferase involved in cell wall biosynthesis
MGSEPLMAEEQEPHTPEVHFLQLKGQNPRTYDFKGLYDLLNEKQPKLIHLDNDPLSLQAVRIGKWAKKNKSNLVCLSCENLKFDLFSSYKRLGFRGMVSSLPKLVLLRKSRKNIDHVFTINDAGTTIFKHYKFKSVSKIPLGVNTDNFYPDEQSRKITRDRLGVAQEKILFAYIGRTVYEKGIHILLEALAQLKHNKNWLFMLDEFKDAKTPYQLQIINMIKDLKLQERVLYFDASHTEIPQYMNAADAIIIPSIATPKWIEQYGRVAPEAMACGKLVVASNVGALPELIKDAGVLVDENNVQALRSVLNDILKHPNSYEIFKSNTLKRASELNIDNQVKMMHDVFNPLLRGKVG